MHDRMVRSVGLMLVFASCLPAPHTLIGASCDNVTDPCPEELFCVFRKCSENVPPDVTVLSSDFEGGTIAPWVRGSLVTTHKHGGAASLRLAGADTTPPNATTNKAALPVATGLHCVTAWALHGLSSEPVTLQLRTYGVSGALSETSPTATFLQPATGKAWGKLATQLFVDAEVVTAIQLMLELNAPTPADFYVDDVTLIRTAKDTCP